MVREAVTRGTSAETMLEARDRRGRDLICRVRVSPLLYEDRSVEGAVILIEEELARSD